MIVLLHGKDGGDKSSIKKVYNSDGLQMSESYQRTYTDEKGIPRISSYSLTRDSLLYGSYTLNGQKAPFRLKLGGEEPERLGGARPNAADIEKHRISPETDDDFEIIATSEANKRALNDYESNVLSEYSKKSPVFRKAAISQGLIKDDSVLSQE